MQKYIYQFRFIFVYFKRSSECIFREPSRTLFHFILYTQTNIAIFTTNKCEKCQSSIQCWDLNPRPSQHESPPITTRPGLPPTKCIFTTNLTYLHWLPLLKYKKIYSDCENFSFVIRPKPEINCENRHKVNSDNESIFRYLGEVNDITYLTKLVWFYIITKNRPQIFFFGPADIFNVPQCDQNWLNRISVWQYLEGLFSIWQNSEPILANFVGPWAHFDYCKWTNYEK